MDRLQQTDTEAVTIDGALARRIQEELGQNVYLCYQCVRCSSGCPLADFLDWQPNQIMRAVQLGQEDIALGAETPWLCAACQTCTTRCPQELDINAIMEFLTREALARNTTPPISQVQIFNEAFMRQVRLWGRAYEIGLMLEMKVRTRDLMGDMDMGLEMMRRHKLALLPHRVRAPRKVRPVPGATEALAYYPGCSLHSTAREFDTSTRAVCAALDLKLIEPEGWICCGSTAAHRSDPEAALRLPLENLRLIAQSGFREVTMPCAACFNRHKNAQYEMAHHEEQREEMVAALDYDFEGQLVVSTMVDALVQHVGTDRIAARTSGALQGLRVVTYYGCLLTRPPQVTGATHHENPTAMDELLAATGAEVVDWSYKTVCCGAAHSLSRPDIVLKLSHNLIDHARAVGADVIAVACPLCHTNLDARQMQMGVDEAMPVLYFTQLLALALGLPEAAALEKNLVDPRPFLRAKGYLPLS